MLDYDKLLELFKKVNNRLKKIDMKGEILVVGGAVMCVAYKSRVSTKDVDAIFIPSQVIRDIVEQIAQEEGLPSDWMNDGAKGYVNQGINQIEMLNFSHLKIWMPEIDYMLAMKCISSRVDSKDKDDIIFLINKMGLKTIDEVLKIISNYYRNDQIIPKTVFFLEEIFEKDIKP